MYMKFEQSLLNASSSRLAFRNASLFHSFGISQEELGLCNRIEDNSLRYRQENKGEHETCGRREP